MYEAGEALGLTGDVLRMFSYTCCEVEVEIEIDMKTGESIILRVDGRTLLRLEHNG